jgi:hypothetical protein
VAAGDSGTAAVAPAAAPPFGALLLAARRHSLSAARYRAVLAARFEAWRQVAGLTAKT